jgi:hypothetical protein
VDTVEAAASLQESAGMGQAFNPYHKWLGIPPQEQPPNYYRLLGIAVFETDPDVIESAADQRMTHLRRYQTSQYAALSQRLLNEVATARVCLLNPTKRTAYDKQLQKTISVQTQATNTGPSLFSAALEEEVLAAKAPEQTFVPYNYRRRSPFFVPILLGLFGIAILVIIVIAQNLMPLTSLEAPSEVSPAPTQSLAPSLRPVSKPANTTPYGEFSPTKGSSSPSAPMVRQPGQSGGVIPHPSVKKTPVPQKNHVPSPFDEPLDSLEESGSGGTSTDASSPLPHSR